LLEPYVDPKGERHPVNPYPKLVNAVLDGLKAEAHLPADVTAPAWLHGATDDDREFAPKNIKSLVQMDCYLPTRTLTPQTPKFFRHNALEFDYNPNAPAAREWHKFLDTLWPGDLETIYTLHEIFGYCLTADTSQQKVFFLIGPRRSGKGTIAKILRQLIGQHNCSAPTLAGLGGEFGLQPLINSLVGSSVMLASAIVSTRRLSLNAFYRSAARTVSISITKI
jgi:putative DNA primase/helicase